MHHAHIDKFANEDSLIHRLDSRAKLIVVVAFSVLVIMVAPYSISPLAWYAVGPFALLILGRVPLGFAFKQIATVSPFILVLAVSCIFFDKEMLEVSFGPWKGQMAGGLVRFFSVIFKFILTMAALIGLVSTTRFNDLLVGMEKLGVPKILVVQLGFLYRYIFLLIDKVGRMLRARSARRLENLGLRHELKVVGSMIGSLLVNSMDMAVRTSIAMEGRGFNGHVRTLSTLKITKWDVTFIAIAAVYMFFLLFLI